MRYIVIPYEDAQIVMTQDELEHAKKSIDGTQVIVHEDILIRKRNAMGLTTLPTEDTGTIEWTYPVYEFGSEALEQLLQSEEWTENIENFKL